MCKGFFLTLDGIDGAGKSTHIAFIKKWLAEHHIQAIFTREPGGTVVGEQIRQILLTPNQSTPPTPRTEALLMFASRQQHLEEVIIPNLNKGLWVVSDRFTDASYAYQCGGRGLAEDQIAQLETWVQQGLQPDATIIFDIDLATAQQRIHNNRTQQDRFEQEKEQFFTNVRAMYLKRAKTHPRYHVVNTSQEIPHIQLELERILNGYLKNNRE